MELSTRLLNEEEGTLCTQITYQNGQLIQLLLDITEHDISCAYKSIAIVNVFRIPSHDLENKRFTIRLYSFNIYYRVWPD